MKKSEILSVNLPKWPELRVIGEKVSTEEVAEILIRTSGLYFSSNNKGFDKKLNKAVDITEEQFGGNYEKYYDQLDKAKAKYRVLDLEYLENRQIVSAYVGGPHGWCHWDGTIQAFGDNIGKWPDCVTIFNEWELIAKTFPFLNLRAQLFSGESCEEDKVAVIEYIVKDGKVRVKKPKDEIFAGISNKLKYRNIFDERTEEGCTIEQFILALRITLNNNPDWF